MFLNQITSKLHVVHKLIGDCKIFLCTSSLLFLGCEKTDSVLLGRQDIPDDFLTQHIECCQYFFDLQSRTILRNLDMYGQVSESMRQIMSDLQDKCVEQYIQVCELEAISNRDRIVPFTPKVRISRIQSVNNYSSSWTVCLAQVSCSFVMCVHVAKRL